MKICVYCGSMDGNRPVYRSAARELGQWIAESGHTLVYGGGGVGLMGCVADAALDAQGAVIGIIPQFLVDREEAHPRVSDLRIVETMAQRKDAMVRLSDAFVALPGGPGTFEEISEVVSLKKLGKITGEAALLNIDGFYDPLAAAYDKQLECGFATEEHRAFLRSAGSVSELAELLEASNALRSKSKGSTR